MFDNFLRKISVYFATQFVVIILCGAAHAEGFLTLEGKLKYDSNLSQARFSQDQVSDMATAINVTAGKYFQLSDYNSLTVTGDLGGEIYNTYHGMNNVSLGGSTTLKRKWGLGLYQPWTAFTLSTTRLDYNNDVRDGWLHKVMFSGGKRISEHWDIWADISLQKRTQDNDNVIEPGLSGSPFDLLNKVATLDAVYAFSENTFLMLGYQWRRGDVVATAITESPIHAVFDPVTTAETADNAFGVEGEAYRLRGTTHTFGAKVNTTINQNYVLGIEYQRYITHGGNGNNYYKSMPALTLSYHF
ncbi:MAG: hypothetical protein ABL880_01610 [Methylotenera sp.]